MSGSLRVAHFCDSHAGRPDGVSRSAALTVGLLRDAGHTVDFYHPGPFLPVRATPGLVRSLPVPGRQLRAGWPWPRCAPADVVHAHTTGPLGMAGFRLAARRRVPLVLTWHTDLLAYADVFPEIPAGAAWCALQMRLGWSAAEFRELTRPGAVRHRRLVALGRAMFARAAVVIAPSAKTAAVLAEFGPGPQIHVLPTPVAAAEPRPPTRPANVILSVGRVTAEKNPELLLQAFRRLLDGRPGTRLIVLGAHQGRAHLQRRLRALGLTDHVDVLPPVPQPEVGSFYHAADVLAFASTTDTQSLVLAEAEAAGLPVVVADSRLADRPGTGTSRFACAPTAPAFAGALRRMLDDGDLRAAAIREGLAATAAYPAKLYLSHLLDIYHSACRHLPR
ncbi:glycosyltransferase [Actinoplanes solisilvae]|uniref:glycosyltransferase n=1 Tax=Actinoplanes solisilvae TaxID=2486853 RepID=UPI0013E30BAE|nr:glycosyltransferase [Actinoplanes solisilvae]